MEKYLNGDLLLFIMILPQLDINRENYLKVAEKLESLSNPLHLQILIILEDGPKTNNQIFFILKNDGLIKFPASSYKAIEKLTRNGIVQKKYDSQRKRVTYFI